MEQTSKPLKNIPKPTHFGKNLKFLRRMKGLSQTQLAKEVDMSRNNIASYESGIVEPNAKRFLLTCDFFGVSPKEMLDQVLSERPTDVTLAANEPEKVIDKYISDQIEQFVIQTNEMTKIYEGYHAYVEMRKDSDNYTQNKELYATLNDLLELLHSLINANWEVIQSIYPVDTSNSEH